MPRLIIETMARSRSSPLITTDTPEFSSPTRFAAGTRQSSNTSSAVVLPRKPILSSFCATWKPGKPFSITKAEMPFGPFALSVLA